MSDLPTIGSSDVATILGVSRWGSVWELWPRLVGLEERYGGVPTAPMIRGSRIEEAVAGWYAQDHRLTLTDCPKVGETPLEGPEDWIHDRPDFFAAPVWMARDRVLEVKTSVILDEAAGWGPSGTDAIPADVAAQACWHLICQTVDRCDVVAFGTLRDDLRGYVIERRERLLTAILGTVRDWYERHIVEGHPPSLDGSHAAARHAHRVMPYVGPTGQMSAKSKRESRIWLTATATDRALHRDILAVRAQIADLEVTHSALKCDVMSRINGAYGIRHEGQTLAIWSHNEGRKSVNLPLLRDELGDGADKYMKQGAPYRALTIRKPKKGEE